MKNLKKERGFFEMTKTAMHDRPLAIKGLTSYRAKGRYGYIMIGARDDADAAREAKRSSDAWRDLEVWDGAKYVPVVDSVAGKDISKGVAF
jgi:hypothetical protein